MSLYINGDQLVTLDKLYSILGITNLLTDEEMNISNAVFSPAAKLAISDINYANGINTFHCKGVADYERINWKFKVNPNTKYRVVIDAKSSVSMPALDTNIPYVPWNINSSQDIESTMTGDIATWHMQLPWQGLKHGEITFNSRNYTEVFLTTNFGQFNDAIDTDITLQIKMYKADSLQDQINQINSNSSAK